MELKRINEGCLQKLRILLIVPYGIETHIIHIQSIVRLTFNRTLWN